MPGSHFIPSRESELVVYAANMSNKLDTNFAEYHVTQAQANSLTAKYNSFQILFTACSEPDSKTPSKMTAKRGAKKELVEEIRMLARIIQANPLTTDQQRTDLGLPIHDTQPTPGPVPADAPGMTVVSVEGRIVNVKLFDPAEPNRRALPAGVNGAIIMSHVGETAPSDPSAYSLRGPVSKTSATVTFGNEVAPGSKVWLTAVWFNGRKQIGPACDPISTYLTGGSMSMAA